MLEKFFTILETTPMSVASWLAAFLGVVWIRYLLESFSSPNVTGYLPSDLPTLLHYTLFYLAAIVLTVVVVGIVTRVPVLRMMRAVIFVLPVIWLGPTIDLVRGVSAHISYVFITTPSALLHDFLTYFGPLTGVGATFGLRIELGVLIFILGIYVYIHTKCFSTTLVGMCALYVVIFTTAVLPSLLGFFLPSGSLFIALQNALVSHSFLHPSETYSAYRASELLFDAVMAQTLFLMLCISSVMWFYHVQKNVVLAVFRNIRLERVALYLVIAFLGGLIALAEGSQIYWTILDLVTIMTAVVVIIFGILFAIAMNDLADESIDTISNIDRPLVTGALTREMMREIGFVCAFMMLLGALALGSYSTFFILIFTASYYVYSTPPLRLKRVPILASVLIGVAALSIIMLGFFLISTNQQLTAFPAPIALLVVLFMALVANVRDIKDIKGDAAAGIWTLPTLLGDHRSRMVIGGMNFIACILVPLFISIKALWIPSLIAGVVSWVGLVRGLGERFVFPLYFIYLASIVLLLRFV